MVQSFWKSLRADAEILPCVIWGHNWAEITYFPEKTIFFGTFTLWEIFLPMKTYFWSEFWEISLHPQKGNFFENFLYLTFICMLCKDSKIFSGILRQDHRCTNNNKSFDLVMTDQVCFIKRVALKIAVLFFISFLHLFFFVLLFTFHHFCQSDILLFSSKNKYWGKV